LLTPSTSTSDSERVPAFYYDGRTAVSHRVDLAIHPSGRLRVEGEGVSVDYALDAVELQPVVANIPRVLLLPGGGQCEIADGAAFDRLIAPRLVRRAGGEQWVQGFESRSAFVVGAVIILAVVVYVLVVHGLPLMASVVAWRISPSLESGLGDQTLAALDRLLLEPTRLDERRRRAIRDRFDTLRREAGDDFDARLEFRASAEAGPNAFTLPGGTIVVLDELVAFAVNDDEIAAVMCHELGHVRHRHVLRTALQNAGVVVLLGAIFGDVFSATSLAATLPLAAVQSSYSRDFEREADEYAVRLMSDSGLDTDHYVKLLERFDQRERRLGERYPDFLTSHPPNRERIEALKTR